MPAVVSTDTAAHRPSTQPISFSPTGGGAFRATRRVSARPRTDTAFLEGAGHCLGGTGAPGGAGPRERLLVDVDEERARQRRVGAVGDGLERGRHRTLAAVDGDDLQLVLVLDVVREAEEADRVGVAGHAGDQHVVVLGRGVVTTA